MDRFSWKLTLVGGLVFYAVQWIVGMATGMLIHEGILKEPYRQTASFWRPELNQEPPDMAALLPRWIAVGLIVAFVMAAIYCFVRPAFAGAGWKKGLKYGVMLAVLGACWNAGWSGIFNLPNTIWFWWSVEALVYFPLSAIALGWVGQKLAPEPAARAA
jgi:hypothetical protein